jgi:hypothetical protein
MIPMTVDEKLCVTRLCFAVDDLCDELAESGCPTGVILTALATVILERADASCGVDQVVKYLLLRKEQMQPREGQTTHG